MPARLIALRPSPLDLLRRMWAVIVLRRQIVREERYAACADAQLTAAMNDLPRLRDGYRARADAYRAELARIEGITA